MITTLHGRFRAWEDGRASITTEDGEITILDRVVVERLIESALATALGPLAFDNPCTLRGDYTPVGVEAVELLIVKTDFVDFHVRGAGCGGS